MLSLEANLWLCLYCSWAERTRPALRIARSVTPRIAPTIPQSIALATATPVNSVLWTITGSIPKSPPKNAPTRVWDTACAIGIPSPRITAESAHATNAITPTPMTMASTIESRVRLFTSHTIAEITMTHKAIQITERVIPVAIVANVLWLSPVVRGLSIIDAPKLAPKNAPAIAPSQCRSPMTIAPKAAQTTAPTSAAIITLPMFCFISSLFCQVLQRERLWKSPIFARPKTLASLAPAHLLGQPSPGTGQSRRVASQCPAAHPEPAAGRRRC